MGLIQTSTTEAPRSDANNAYDLLDDVVACIEAEPLRLAQGTWIALGRDLSTLIRLSNVERGPACGTAGCVAGWMCVLKRGDEMPGYWGVEGRAMEMLGVYDDDDDGHVALFEVRTLFGGQVDDDDGHEIGYGHPEYVPLVVRRIRNFQREHEQALKERQL
jgi:hypothetical protein